MDSEPPVGRCVNPAANNTLAGNDKRMLAVLVNNGKLKFAIEGRG
jgi:hypothetical protein